MNPGSTADGIFPPDRRYPSHPSEGTPKRRSASKKGASRHPEGDRRGASRQAPTAVVFRMKRASATKGRVCHRWWRRGERAPGTRQIRLPDGPTCVSAVRPDTGDDVTLVMPSVNAKVMDLFLAHFAVYPGRMRTAVMMCDVRRLARLSAPSPSPTTSPWRCCRLTVPTLNPVERVWLYLRERLTLSLRVLDDTEAIIDACCQAPDRPHRRTGSYANKSAPIAMDL